LVKTVDPKAKYTAIAQGLAATPAAAVGKVVFDPEKAVEMALREEQVILVRAETSPEDVAGMHAAQGVLTSRGGLTSHAAVVARTEHMFFKGDRMRIVREMIMSRDERARRKAVDSLLPFQREDFIGIFTAMHGFPVTIRLLDPPLHEFLPKCKEVLEEYARLA